MQGSNCSITNSIITSENNPESKSIHGWSKLSGCHPKNDNNDKQANSGIISMLGYGYLHWICETCEAIASHMSASSVPMLNPFLDLSIDCFWNVSNLVRWHKLCWLFDHLSTGFARSMTVKSAGEFLMFESGIHSQQLMLNLGPVGGLTPLPSGSPWHLRLLVSLATP